MSEAARAEGRSSGGTSLVRRPASAAAPWRESLLARIRADRVQMAGVAADMDKASRLTFLALCGISEATYRRWRTALQWDAGAQICGDVARSEGPPAHGQRSPSASAEATRRMLALRSIDPSRPALREIYRVASELGVPVLRVYEWRLAAERVGPQAFLPTAQDELAAAGSEQEDAAAAWEAAERALRGLREGAPQATDDTVLAHVARATHGRRRPPEASILERWRVVQREPAVRPAPVALVRTTPVDAIAVPSDPAPAPEDDEAELERTASALTRSVLFLRGLRADGVRPDMGETEREALSRLMVAARRAGGLSVAADLLEASLASRAQTG